MFEKEFDIANLISLQQKGVLDAAKQSELDSWLAARPQNRMLYEQLAQAGTVQDSLQKFSAISEERAWSKVLGGITTLADHDPIRKLWPKLFAAAAAVTVVMLGFLLYRSSMNESLHPATESVINDISPGGNGATLTLSNGQIIKLNASKAGALINGTSMSYQDGSGITSPDGQQLADTKMAVTASTANGQTYCFTLDDGTRVWLNSGSTLNFPKAFSGKERRVRLEGEGYFEVAKDRSRPFLVESKRQILQVLGTHFNINNYSDEQNVKTTLLEGSVEVSTPSSQQRLKLVPGEQSLVSDHSLSKQTVDVAVETAWRQGYFRFNDEPIESVMRKLSRWYNIEVVYQNGIPKHRLNGRVSRSNHISKVLNALKTTNAIHFKIEGRRVTVMK